MLLLNSEITDPYFNLAMEEYFLKTCSEDMFFLWRNESSIIIGRNQNTINEINQKYIEKNNIPVVRRLSGGGAVFHDLGNINFTFLSPDNLKDFNNFKKFTTPIINMLHSMGINAEFTGRNDITIEGRKISGNAQCSYKNRIMHHGTLLFSSNVADISNALNVSTSKLKSHGVASVSSRVTNISSYLNNKLTVREFMDKLCKYIADNNSDTKLYFLTEYDIKQIKTLVKDKYSTWLWNYGHSPKYTYTSSLKYPGGTIEFTFAVINGCISKIKLYGDFFGEKAVSELETLITGTIHDKAALKASLEDININDYFEGLSLDEFINALVGQS